jgi:hypothetical protein
MRTYVPDEVWQALDPDAGRLSRRTTIRGSIAFVLVLVLMVAAAVVWSAGLVVPRLAWPGNERSWEENPEWVRVRVVVVNAGWWPVTVREVGRSGPGLELLGVEGPGRAASPFPVTLQPDGRVEATLVYRITDCANYPRGSWPVTAVVDRPWGAMTVDVEPEYEWPVWQENVVQTWCRPGGPGG